ncbi:MAG: hypothetical protein JW786_07530 [Desulfobacterales bacterium]|nr:hypothetical protein [Desulfobacterales bacterium]
MAIMKFETREKTLRLNEIFKDDGIYPREKIDEKRIEFFSNLMKEGTIFPPIKIVKDKSGKHILLDGFHRYSAFKKLQRNEIACDLIDAEPHLWRLLSVRFNFDSSQPLKFGEIKKAIYDTWCKDNIRDKQQIADMLGCSVKWVRKVVKDLERSEEVKKLILARKIKEEENSSIRDIAKRIGWSKSKAHRLLIETTESDEEPQSLTVNADQTTEENNRDPGLEIQSQAEPAYLHAEKVIENFDRFGHPWEPDQKETLYAFDGIKNNLPVEAISGHIDKNPAWIRNAAYILLSLYHHDEDHAKQAVAISENLSVNIGRINFIHWLFTHWQNILPERKPLFQWILSNQSRYRDDRINKLVRLEHLYWHSKNVEAEKIEEDENGQHLLTELSAETLSYLSQISGYFENLKRYLRNYDIETVLAKDLLERINRIMISQNRIQDQLHKFI